MKNKKYYLPLIHPGNISLYPFFRIGGFGLGNMLFPFFRSLFLSIKDGAILMYPHHFQIQPRNLLFNLNINSVRNYSSDFSKLSWCSLPKNKSAYIFYKKRWESENEINNASNIYFSGLKNYFFDLIDFQEEIQEFIYHSFSYKPKIRMNVVAFHLRLGDFIRNKQAINREKIINTFDFFLKQSKIIEIYSDTPKNKILNYLDLEKLPNNIFINNSLSPMMDIIEIAQAEYICGSPYSTFVEWAKFIRPAKFPKNSYSLLDKNKADLINVSPLKWDNFV